MQLEWAHCYLRQTTHDDGNRGVVTALHTIETGRVGVAQAETEPSPICVMNL
jgi:hypothetical protein